MAAIVSTRILRLQAISPRTSAVDLQSGINVPAAATVAGTVASTLVANAAAGAKQSFGTNLVFSSASATQVNWSSGTVVDAAGGSYSIASGNTGTMAALTYIYLDTAVSTTVLQTTTTYSTAIGAGKTMIAAAQNATAGASVVSFGGQQPIINGAQITALSILAGAIAAGTITSDKLSVSTLSAITANLGTVTAGDINSSGILKVTGSLLVSGSNYASIQAIPSNTANWGHYGESATGVGVLGKATGAAGVGVYAWNSSTGLGLNVVGNAAFSGDFYLYGNSWTGNAVPSVDIIYSLGTTSNRFDRIRGQFVYGQGLVVPNSTVDNTTTTQGMLSHATSHYLAASRYSGGAVPTLGTAPYLYFNVGGFVIGFLDAIGTYYNRTNW